MIQSFNEKVIISGDFVEHYQYLNKAILKGYIRRPRLPRNNQNKNKKESKEAIREKTEFAVNRARTNMRRLINSNPTLNKFLTLTFRTKMFDLSKANKLFNTYIRRMNKHFPRFQYIAIVEFQKNGRVHYHLLCNLEYVPAKKLEEIWQHGFINIKRIDRINNIGAYICKYLRKDMFDERMFGKKKFFRSQDLDKPAEILGDNANLFMKKGINNLKLDYESEFENEHRGKIVYRHYHY